VGEEQPGPGSKVVTEYLDAAGLTPYLNTLGFNLVGYGCTTCIGNSGPLPDEVSSVVRDKNLVVCSVLSGNRNFEGRIQQDVRANYLASPPLVVAYALAGWITKDLTVDPLGEDQAGNPVYLKDIWPTEQELQATMLRSVTKDMFRSSYSDVFKGDERWQSLQVLAGSRFTWDEASTYIRKPTFVDGMTMTPPKPANIAGARVLALLGDSVTTDHISPAARSRPTAPPESI
jgi:aconitate hydratase